LVNARFLPFVATGNAFHIEQINSFYIKFNQIKKHPLLEGFYNDKNKKILFNILLLTFSLAHGETPYYKSH